MSLLLNGKVASQAIASALKQRAFGQAMKPCLAIVQIGDKEESNAYIARKKKFGEAIGVLVRHVRLGDSVLESEVASTLRELNGDPAVHGIILQLPIPERLNVALLLGAIALQKDMDGLAPESQFTPATARGILALLAHYKVKVAGRRVAVLGRSRLVGAPTALLLEQNGALVTVCHSKTADIPSITRASDIVVVAIGKPKFIGADYFRDDRTQTVVDVGITAVTKSGTEKLEEEIPKRTVVGDVDFESVKNIVAAISPVPGGVGPMTVAALFLNLIEAYEKQR